jgi:prepilin-type N-terminal cleavage/methylation domain-containing protein
LCGASRIHRRRGFTALEVTVVLAIIGLLSSLAVASLREMMLVRQGAGAAQALASALGRARALAVHTHSRVRVDALPAGLSLTSCPARFGSPECATTTTFTAVAQGTTDLGQRSEFVGIRVTAPVTTLIFDAAGFPETAATYVWTVEHRRSPVRRDVVVNGGGEIRVR